VAGAGRGLPNTDQLLSLRIETERSFKKTPKIQKNPKVGKEIRRGIKHFHVGLYVVANRNIRGRGMILTK